MSADHCIDPQGFTLRPHFLLWLVLLFLFVAFPVHAQEFVPERVVFPITDFKPDPEHLGVVSIKFATGFCLDANCRFVGTNYHAAKRLGKYVRIKGVFSAQRYLDSASDDAGAENVDTGGGLMKYTPAHDLAVYEMRHPIKNLHGISFETEDDLFNGLEADIYGYPYTLNPKRKLVRWHCKLIGKTPQGLLAFSYEEGRIRDGASGGIVVDSKTQKIVGILSGMVVDRDRIALAVPIEELSNFVKRAQPYLQATLFPKTVFISPVAADIYPLHIGYPAQDSSDSQGQYEEAKLRSTARHLADAMYNFVATQTFSWGSDNGEPELTDAYETMITDGQQSWRHSGKEKFKTQISIPVINAWLIPGGMWHRLPEQIGWDHLLKLHRMPETVVGGRTIHVFQYSANAEDGECWCRYYLLPGIWSKLKSYNCHGEIWTDESGDILRISQGLDLTGPFYHYWAVMTYGWLEKDGTRYLLPVSIAGQAETKKGKTFWCRGLFTDYDKFDVKTHLMTLTEN